MNKKNKHEEDITEIKTKIDEVIKNTKKPFYERFIFWLLVVLAVSGVSVISVWQIFKDGTPGEETSAFAAETGNKMYLSSELPKPRLNTDTMIWLTTEFEAAEVVITGTSPTGETDRLDMQQYDKLTWNKKVKFVEVGLWTVTAAAKTVDGEEVTESMTIEVVGLFD